MVPLFEIVGVLALSDLNGHIARLACLPPIPSVVGKHHVGWIDLEAPIALVLAWAPRRSAGFLRRHPSHPRRKNLAGTVGDAPAMGGGMDSFIVSMFAAKRVVSFCSDHAAAEPFGSYGVSLVVEVDTDEAVSRTARVILNFVEHSIFLPFAGRTPLARTVLSDMDGMEMIVQFRVAGFGFGKPFRKCIA